MTTSALPFASIENKFLRLDYLTTTGPRVIGLYAQGVEGNLFAETPDAHWPTPHGEYYLRGGHRLWTAPEDPFYTCPEVGLSVIEEAERVVLRSSIDAAGLEKEISLQLDASCVHVTHRITWHGDKTIELAPWAITQLRLGGMAILPQAHEDGLQPDRNLVFWPYSQIADARLEMHDDTVLIHARASGQAFKLGGFNKLGWIACTLGSAVFVKRFTSSGSRGYPDLGCNAEIYVRDTCIELESLGPLAALNPNDDVTHDESWEVITDVDYPPTVEAARAIRARLSST